MPEARIYEITRSETYTGTFYIKAYSEEDALDTFNCAEAKEEMGVFDMECTSGTSMVESISDASDESQIDYDATRDF